MAKTKQSPFSSSSMVTSRSKTSLKRLVNSSRPPKKGFGWQIGVFMGITKNGFTVTHWTPKKVRLIPIKAINSPDQTAIAVDRTGTKRQVTNKKLLKFRKSCEKVRKRMRYPRTPYREAIERSTKVPLPLEDNQLNKKEPVGILVGRKLNSEELFKTNESAKEKNQQKTPLTETIACSRHKNNEDPRPLVDSMNERWPEVHQTNLPDEPTTGKTFENEETVDESTRSIVTSIVSAVSSIDISFEREFISRSTFLESLNRKRRA